MATVYSNRDDAARQLAARLRVYRDRNPLVLAIPRGAVPMGRIVADALGGDLDIVLVRKLGAPGNPELAIGAIDETGWTYLADFARSVGADERYIGEIKTAQLQLLGERRSRYTPSREPIDPAGRIAIVIDDGLATGATMIAALHCVRAKRPARLVCAVPVAPQECIERIRPYADEVIALQTPADFYAVGQFYRDFRQVEDAEVVRLLQAPASPSSLDRP